MTQDEIIEITRQAELDWHTGWVLNVEQPNRFEIFAKLVAAKERADEREACAKVCEDYGTHNITVNCAKVIRARGEA